MKTDCNQTLENGLSVLVDWIAFTMKDAKEPQDAFELLGIPSSMWYLMPSGSNGYKQRYSLVGHSISVLFDGNDGMGVHVVITGSSVNYALSCYHDKRLTPTAFGSDAYDADRMDSTVLSDFCTEVLSVGSFTRLDLAIDDVGANYFDMKSLAILLDLDAYVSRFHSHEHIVSGAKGHKTLGETIYWGSPKSLAMLRIYDKQLEQNAKRHKKSDMITCPWVRWELELKKDRATSAARLLSQGMPLGDVTIGILANYVRFILLDNENASRCSNHPVWESFIAGVAGLRLFIPRSQTSIEEKKDWLKKQVAPTLAAVLIADGGDAEFLMELLENGSFRIRKPLKCLIEDYQARNWASA